MRDPKQALKEHYNEITKYYSEAKILGIFLYGSQNYHIATESSDVDSIAILVPDMDDLIFKTPVSKEIHFANGEHCVVKDIREIVKMWKKQNINFLEILFTDYFYIHEFYVPFWNNFLDIKDKIVYYDVEKTFNSISGQTKHIYLRNPDDNKTKANALRMYYFLRAYLSGLPYKDCLTDSWNIVLDVKEGRLDLTDKGEDFLSKFDKLKENIRVESNPEVARNLDDYLYEIICTPILNDW